jgi:hypothetical protein
MRRIDVYCEACRVSHEAETGVVLDPALIVEIDLEDYAETPTPAALHSNMPSVVLSVCNQYAKTHEDSAIELVGGHEDDWGSCVGEVSSWTIEHAYEMHEAAEAMHDEEAFWLYVTDYVSRNEDAHSAKERFEEAYQGTFVNAASYAHDLYSQLNEGTDMTVWPFNCIDWDVAGEYLEQCGDVTFLELEYGGYAAFNPSV